MAVLIDSGFLYAFLNRSEAQHQAVVRAVRSIAEPIFLPIPATTEVAYLLLRDVGPLAVADFVTTLSGTAMQLIAPEAEDYTRAAEIILEVPRCTG